MTLYKKYGNHPLFGRRILHILSPVRWSSNKFIHGSDSNYRVYNMIVDWLPMCHHITLVPQHNSINESRTNVSLIKHPYPHSVLYNRGFFDSKAFLKEIDFTKIDFDYIFCHQPEILYNVMNAFQTGRYGTSVSKFIFFHWVDSPKSRPTTDYPEGFFRQLEGINLSTKSFFHCEMGLEYLKSNWKKKEHAVLGINDNYMTKKISYMPLGLKSWQNTPSEPIQLPKNKKILVFNHRWNNSTGMSKLIEYTKDLDRNEWLVWITDKDAKAPKAGSPAPDWMKVQYLNSKGQYKYLLENCFATLCFVDDYMTWNLSVQDGIDLNVLSLTYEHPTMKYILGDNYPEYFKNKNEFIEKLKYHSKNKLKLKWKLPNHDSVFKANLINDMIENIPKITREPGSGREWLFHMMNDINYKKHLLYNTHQNLFLSNSWERIRLWVLENGGYDDPESKFTRLFIRPEKEMEIKELIKNLNIKQSLKDPKFNVGNNRFWV